MKGTSMYILKLSPITTIQSTGLMTSIRGGMLLLVCGLEDVWETQWWSYTDNLHAFFKWLRLMQTIHLPGSRVKVLRISSISGSYLAEEMIYNQLTESGGVRTSSIRAKKRSRLSLEPEHE